SPHILALNHYHCCFPVTRSWSALYTMSSKHVIVILFQFDFLKQPRTSKVEPLSNVGCLSWHSSSHVSEMRSSTYCLAEDPSGMGSPWDINWHIRCNSASVTEGGLKSGSEIKLL